MSWNMLKRIAKKKTKSAISVFEKEKVRIDLDLPLNIRIGSGINFEETNFLLVGEESYVGFPGAGNTVVAIGKGTMLGMEFIRVYLDNQGEESVLQLIVDEDEPKQAMLFRVVDEVFPEEWDEWLGDEGHIGAVHFYTPDEIELRRCWSDQDAPVDPECFTETIYTDKFGEDSIVVEHQAMMYSRSIALGDDTTIDEELFVSAEESDDGAQVRIAAGLPLELHEIEVL